MKINKDKYEKRPQRAKLDQEEILKRLKEVPQRMEKIIAALRKVQD